MTVQNELTVEVSRDKVKARSQGGAVSNGELHFDQLRLATIRVFEELLLDDTIHIRRHMEVLGQHLYEGLFDKDIHNLLVDQLRDVRGKGRLRLQLTFEGEADPEIVRLPWEFLYSPTKQDFLATDVDLVLSHFMELKKNREEWSATEHPLRILVVISRPQDERAVLAKDVINAIKDLNSGPEETVRLELVEPPTLQSIEEALKRHQPHIFHFIGHGRYDPGQKTGYLLLVDPDTQNAEPCDDSTIIDCFRRAKWFPRLVFLHMCEGGITEKDPTAIQAFGGFAPKLIHAKIASVVAMQYPIKNEDARDFSLAFYSTLADGGSVDEAVQEGRGRLDLYRRSRVFGTPVLYMHSAEALVLPKPRTESAGSTSMSDTEGRAATTTPQAPAPDAAPKPVGVEQAFLDNLINNVGITAAQSIPDSNDKIAMTQRLLRMKQDLMGKARPDIFSEVFRDWKDETNKDFKEVLQKIMEVI